ncbi:unnamed protein product [Spirodela intermedia]|uniref:Uncharacterized protein n=1 Tax=Spirodela intermedia TaxID=51605 RepID=A0A7I8KJI1_SPIIN|nr:unnamed protein product [Spirodela intermedia]
MPCQVHLSESEHTNY